MLEWKGKCSCFLLVRICSLLFYPYLTDIEVINTKILQEMYFQIILD